jgi:hypothetical protein
MKLDDELPVMVPVRRAAKKIGISYNTLLRHEQDFFQVHRLGSHYYVAAADLVAWIAKRTGGSPANDSRSAARV